MQRSGAAVAVVGGGPAGIAAAHQLIREGIEDVVLIEKKDIGGLIYYANKIENIPGFTGCDGRTIVDELKQILKDDRIHVINDRVGSVDVDGDQFKIVCSESSLRSEYLVLATGTNPKTLDIPGEICEPPWQDHRGEKVIIVGGGDAAYDYALRIDRYGGDVTILSRNEPCAVKTLLDQVRRSEITEKTGEVVSWIKEEGGYVLRTADDTFTCHQVVTAIGREPCIPDLGFGHGEVHLPTGKTSVEKLYLVGSVVLGKFRQMPLCWGMGIAAGMSIKRSIQNNRK